MVSKVVVLLLLRIERGGEEREVLFVQYSEVTAPLSAVEINLVAFV